MAVTYDYKVLGQAQVDSPSTLVYSVPEGKSSVVSTVALSNVSFTDAAITLNVYAPSLASAIIRTDYWVSKGTPGYQPQITGLAYGDNMYVAVGRYGSGPASMAIWSSTDAITWVTRAQYQNGQYFNAVAFGNGHFVAVGDYGYVLNSTDGITWVSRSSSWAGNQTSTGQVMTVVFGDSKFVISGYNGYTNYSSDGSSWSSGNTITGGSASVTLGYGNNVYMAVSGSTVYKTSTDGITWTTRTNPASGSTVTSLSYVTGTYVMGGTNLYTSTDAITWVSRTNPFGNTIDSIASGRGKLVGGTGSSPILVSTDGITWTTPLSSSFSSVENIAYTGTTFIANNGYDVIENLPYSGPDNALLYQTTIPANSTTNLTFGLGLGEGTSLYATASTSGAITVHAFGSEIY